VPERWGVLYNLVPAYGRRESNILFFIAISVADFNRYLIYNKS